MLHKVQYSDMSLIQIESAPKSSKTLAFYILLYVVNWTGGIG